MGNVNLMLTAGSDGDTLLEMMIHTEILLLHQLQKSLKDTGGKKRLGTFACPAWEVSFKKHRRIWIWQLQLGV